MSLYLNYRKLPQFKGPFLASISGLWLFRETLAGRMYVTCAEALETYGMGSSNSLQFRRLFLLSKSCVTRLACPDQARHDRHPRPSHSETHERTRDRDSREAYGTSPCRLTRTSRIPSPRETKRPIMSCARSSFEGYVFNTLSCFPTVLVPETRPSHG